MASLVENINQARLDFQAIRASLIGKNLLVPAGTPTSQYSSLIDTLDTRNIQDFQQWLMYGNIDYTLYENLEQVLASSDYDVLLQNEASAAYAAFLAEDIANGIKNNSTYLKKALISEHNYMFFNSSFNFEENIENLLEENEKVTKDNYKGIVTFDADRCTNPEAYDYPYPDDRGYYGYMAFDGSLDSEDLHINYSDRHVWSALGTNHWVQYKYSEPKFLYCIYVYSVRDNAPVSIIVSGSNNGENFVTIKEQQLSGTVGAANYDKVVCCNQNAYQYYRFTISDSVYAGSCNVGEIRMFSFK